MTRLTTLLLAACGIAATIPLGASPPLPTLAHAQPGLWEISGAPGFGTPVRQCVADIAVLARFEHRARSCATKLLRQKGSITQFEYSCGGADFGHSEVEVLTPRSLRISTQGISDGLPFNYLLQARRVDDCPKSVSLTRH